MLLLLTNHTKKAQFMCLIQGLQRRQAFRWNSMLGHNEPGKLLASCNKNNRWNLGLLKPMGILALILAGSVLQPINLQSKLKEVGKGRKEGELM